MKEVFKYTEHAGRPEEVMKVKDERIETGDIIHKSQGLVLTKSCGYICCAAENMKQLLLV